jgi:hypothetical protein
MSLKVQRRKSEGKRPTELAKNQGNGSLALDLEIQKDRGLEGIILESRQSV